MEAVLNLCQKTVSADVQVHPESELSGFLNAKDIAASSTGLSEANAIKLGYNDIVNADPPYAPPFSLAIDHGIAAALVLEGNG